MRRVLREIRAYFATLREHPCRRGHSWSQALGYGYLCEACGQSQRGY